MKRRQALALTCTSAVAFLFPGSFADAGNSTGWRHAALDSEPGIGGDAGARSVVKTRLTISTG